MKQARIARPGEPYCSQHHQPRSQCDPRSRHPWSLRASDELMAKVEAKAAAMGLDRNAGVEMALEEWAARVEDASGTRARARGSDEATRREEPPAARKEPSRQREEESFLVAANDDLAALIEQLRAKVEEIQTRISRPAPRAASIAGGSLTELP